MSEYQPLFMEEILLVHIYGSDEEILRFDALMTTLDREESLVEITVLIEEIKRRNVSKMDWNCCHRCASFRVCKINWARGERDIPRNCCSLCPNYEDCRARRRRLEASGDEPCTASPPAPMSTGGEAAAGPSVTPPLSPATPAGDTPPA